MTAGRGEPITRERILQMQEREITEHEIYVRIAKQIKNDEDRATLMQIAREEKKHYDIWRTYTKRDVSAHRGQILWYTLLSKLLGYTFVIKKMENATLAIGLDVLNSDELTSIVPAAHSIYEDELVHEQKLIAMLDEERLRYVGSIVLGLNDALVEFTGSLAGYTFAMQSNKLIALTGLITGISATLSMTASAFLQARADVEEGNDGNVNAKKSAMYTGLAYLLTVVVLILPYLLLPDQMYGWALAIMLCLVVGIIAAFNYYVSVAKNLSFRRRFGEMAGISLGVAAVSFVIGIAVKRFLGVDI